MQTVKQANIDRLESSHIESNQRLLSNGLTLACLKQCLTTPTNSQVKSAQTKGKGDNGGRLSNSTVLTPEIKQNKTFKKASISVSINRGHFHSQDYPEGFAHLLEHMLFTSSEVYVKADALDQHLFKFHGQVNGWTQDLSTHFTLQCDPEGFIQACEILIDRLARPLFMHEHIQAEVTAIDAEFRAKAKTPVRQLLSVQKATSNPKHPFARFSTGNRASLLGLPDSENRTSKESEEDNLRLTPTQLDNLQEKLKAYHAQTMLGKHMSVAIGFEDGSIADDELEKIISQFKQAFKATPDFKGHIKQGTEQKLGNSADESIRHIPVYAKEHLARFIEMETQHKNHQLLFSYQVTKVPSSARDSLFVMLTHTIESKHKRSLYDTLKTRALIKDLQAYYKSIDTQTDELVISLQLSPKGFENVPEVYSVVQQFLDFLQASGIEDWRYREKQQQFELQRQLQRPPGLLENCISVSQNLPFMPANQCLQAPEFDAGKAIAEMPEVLSRLNADNLRLYLMSDQVRGKLSTPFNRAKYKVAPLSNIIDAGKPLQLAFSKARQNPFMSTHHPMVLREVAATELQHFACMGAELKFYQNTELGKANGECYISISDPNMFTNAKQIAIKRVWLACLQIHLAQLFFDVDLASIHFRVYAHQFGISIHTGGLSERQLLLAIELINTVKGFKANKTSILDQIEHCTNTLNTNLDQKPFNRLFSFLNEFYQEPSKSNRQILNELLTLSPQDVMECQAHYFKDNYIESLVVGNWTLNSVARFFKQTSQRFNAQKLLSKPSLQIEQIATSKHLHESVAELKECNLIRHFIPILSPQERILAARSKPFVLQLSARCLILEKLLANPVFDTLRQKHKMGYMLGVGYKPISRLPGIAIYISSPTHTEDAIYHASNEAVKLALTMFTKSKGMLKHLVDDLVKQVSPKDADISQIAARIWMHYDDKNPALAYQDMVKALRDIEESEICAALNSLLNEPLGHIVLTQSASNKLSLY